MLQTEIEGLGGVSVPVLILAGSTSADETKDLARRAADALESGEFRLVDSDARGVSDTVVADAIEEFLD